MADFWTDFPGMPEALDKVLGVINTSISSQNPVIRDALSSLFDGNGKLLRPGLLLIASRFGKPQKEKEINLAAALEMLHVSTLVHDDVIDDSPFRRGIPAVHSKYGKKDAVLIGDFLMSRSFLVTAEYTSPEQAVNLARVISIICTMEIEQNASRFHADSSIRRYFRKIMGKTALLFSLACHVGAFEAKAPRAVTETLRRAGYNIGMAFQIIDDILDYSGEETVVGKPLGRDLKDGIVTLPLITALKKDKSGELAKLCSKDTFQKTDINSIITLVHELGGTGMAGAYARQFTNRALNEIDKLPRGTSRDMLEKLTNNLLIRNY